MKSLPPHYSWLPFSASRSVRFFYLAPSRSNFTPSVGPPLHFSVHRFAIPSFSAPLLLHLKYKRPFDSFSKQTDFISFSFFFFCLSCPTSINLYSLFFTPRYTFKHTQRDTHVHRQRQRARERMSAQQLSTSWLNRVFHLHEDRRRIESERPASRCFVGWPGGSLCHSSLHVSSSLHLLCSLSRCVGCCLLTPRCVTLLMCL